MKSEGFLYMMGIELPEDRYATADEQRVFFDKLLAELRATAGIDAARVMQESGAARFTREGTEYASSRVARPFTSRCRNASCAPLE